MQGFAPTKRVGEVLALAMIFNPSPGFAFAANAKLADPLTNTRPEARKQIYNMAVGDRSSLNKLFDLLRGNLGASGVATPTPPVYRAFSNGDIRQGQAQTAHLRAEGGAEARSCCVTTS